MSFMSVWSQYMKLELITDALVAGRSTKVSWLAPVYAGDVLSGTVTVISHTRRNVRNGLVTVSMDVKNHDGVLVIESETEMVIKTRDGE